MGNEESVESPPLGDVTGQDDIIEEMNSIIANNGVDESKKKLARLLVRWQQIPVNVCVVGQRGSGKSSFINNMAGRTLASIGQAETTSEAKSYPHPTNEKLKFWDLPGYGAKLFGPMDSYIKAMRMERFDIILFLHKDTFMQNDSELYNEIKKVGKPCFLVRSRFDIDVQDGNEEHARNVITSEIMSYGIIPDSVRCYFISNRNYDYDYGDLMADIFNAFKGSCRKEAFAFSIGNRNRTILQIKQDQLQKRIVVAATIAAAVGAIPVPGLDVMINTSRLMEEVVFMGKVLGIINFIDDMSRLECAQISANYLKEIGLRSAILKSAAIMLGDDVLKFIPIVGSIVNSVISFAITKRTLQKILDKFIEVAREKMRIEEQQ